MGNTLKTMKELTFNGCKKEATKAHLDAKADLYEKPSIDTIELAVDNNNLKALEYFAKRYPEIVQKSFALNKTVISRKSEALNILLDNGINPYKKDIYGFSPDYFLENYERKFLYERMIARIEEKYKSGGEGLTKEQINFYKREVLNPKNKIANERYFELDSQIRYGDSSKVEEYARLGVKIDIKLLKTAVESKNLQAVVKITKLNVKPDKDFMEFAVDRFDPQILDYLAKRYPKIMQDSCALYHTTVQRNKGALDILLNNGINAHKINSMLFNQYHLMKYEEREFLNERIIARLEKNMMKKDMEINKDKPCGKQYREMNL